MDGQQSVALHDGICGPPGMERGPEWNPALPLLLLPAGYRVRDHITAPTLMAELLLVSLERPLNLTPVCQLPLPRKAAL